MGNTSKPTTNVFECIECGARYVEDYDASREDEVLKTIIYDTCGFCEAESLESYFKGEDDEQ